MGKRLAGELEFEKKSPFHIEWKYQWSVLGKIEGNFKTHDAEVGWRIEVDLEWMERRLSTVSYTNPVSLEEIVDLLRTVLASAEKYAKACDDEITRVIGES